MVDPVHKVPASEIGVDVGSDRAERIVRWGSYPSENKAFRCFGVNFCFPIYNDAAGAGTVTYVRRSGFNGPINMTTGPWRDSWKPAAGSDAALIARDPATGKHYGFWGVGTAFYLGPTRYLPVGAAYIFKDPNDVVQNYQTSLANMRGATGSGYIPHPVTRAELEAELIEHWVPMYISNAMKGPDGFAVSPAGNYEQNTVTPPFPEWNTTHAVPEGTRWRLDPSFYTDTYIASKAASKYPTNARLAKWYRAMGKALRDYGAFVQATGPNAGFIFDRITDLPEDLISDLIDPTAPHVMTCQTPVSTLKDGTKTSREGWATDIRYNVVPDPDPDPDPPTQSDLVVTIGFDAPPALSTDYTLSGVLVVKDATALGVEVSLLLLSANLGTSVTITGDLGTHALSSTPTPLGDLVVGTYSFTLTGDQQPSSIDEVSAVGLSFTADNAASESPADATEIIPTEYDMPTILDRLTPGIRNIIASTITGGTNVTTSYNSSTGVLTISAAGGGGGGGLTTEDVQDIVGAALVAGSNVTTSYNDAAGTVTISVTGLLPTSYLDPDGTLAADSDTKIATQKAVRTYVQAEIAGLGGGGGGNGGYGPNWVAASNAPTAVKSAVLAAGGVVADGTSDQLDIEGRISAGYRHVCLTQGTFNINSTVDLVRACHLQGSGIEVTVLNVQAGITGRVIYGQNTDHVTISDLSISGNNAGSSVHGIEVACASNSGFPSHQSQEACTVIQNVQIHDVSGHGVSMSGTYNRDSKLRCIDVHNAGGAGFFINCPDGKMSQCVAGSPGTYGFSFDGAANWHADNCKAWYCPEDGFALGVNNATGRVTLTACEAQDCTKAGFRVVKANAPTLTGCIADSNSNSSGNVGTWSGFEIYTTSGSYVTGGATLTGCVAYDKNEGGRGYRQAYGFRFGSGVRRLTFVGCNTGDADAHHNLTGGVVFNTAGDASNSANVIFSNNHGAVVKSF